MDPFHDRNSLDQKITMLGACTNFNKYYFVTLGNSQTAEITGIHQLIRIYNKMSTLCWEDEIAQSQTHYDAS